MKRQGWFSLWMVVVAGLLTGCSSGGDTPVVSTPMGTQAHVTDSFTPKSDELTAEETGLISAGESEPEARRQRPQG